MPEKEKVTLKLAHPLVAHHAVRLGLEDEDYEVGDEIELSRGLAKSVINSGYAQVDSEDPDAVAEALGVPAKPDQGTGRASRSEGSTTKQPSSADPVAPPA